MTEEKWREHFKNWKASGLSQADYCRENGISQHSFTYWRTKLGAAPKKQSSSFIEIRRPESVQGFELIAGEVTVKVPPGFDAKDLSRLLEALR